LHWAAFNGDEDVIYELLNHGADPHVLSHVNTLAIDVAGSGQYHEVIDAFLNHFSKEHGLHQLEESEVVQ